MKYTITFIGYWKKSIEKRQCKHVKEVLALNKEEAIQIFVLGYRIALTTVNIATSQVFKIVISKFFILLSISLSSNIVQHIFLPIKKWVTQTRGFITFS